MINDWDCVATADVGEGEKLVAISWIDTGIKVCMGKVSPKAPQVA